MGSPQLRNDNLKMFDQAWKETLMAMENGLDMSRLNAFFCFDYWKSRPS